MSTAETIEALTAEYRDLDAQYQTLKERMEFIEKRKAEIARLVLFGPVLIEAIQHKEKEAA